MSSLEVGSYIRGVNTESGKNKEITGIVQSICRKASNPKENGDIILLEIQVDKFEKEANKEVLRKRSINEKSIFTLDNDDLKYWQFSLIS